MPKHEIYNFLKENGLTQKDEASFVKEYSDPKKAAELHKFLTDNGLTQKDSASFYDTYFNPSKKKEPQYSSVSPTAAKPSIPTFGAIKVSTTPAQQVLKEQPKIPTPASTPQNDFAALEKLYEQKRNAQSKITTADSYTVANELPQSMLDQMNEPYVQEVSKLDKQIEQQRTALKPIIASQSAAVERNWQAFTKEGVPDYEKIYNYAGQVSKKMGGGSNVKEEVAKVMIDAANSGRIASAADKKFQEKTGFTPQSFVAEKKNKGGFTPEDAITLENLYKASVNEVVREEGETKEAVAAALPLMQKVGAAFLSGIKGGVASQGSGLAALGFSNEFTDYLRGFRTGAEQVDLPQKEWTFDNITKDPLGTVLPFVAQQSGVSLPGMLTGIGASLATGSPVAGAIISTLSEKASNVGDTYTQLVEQGLPVDVAKERAANLMRPMVTDALNFVEMDFLLKGIKGKGNILVNALVEGGTESTAEVQQQFEQAKAVNPNLTFEQFAKENDLPDLIAKTFISSAAMGGGISTIGKVYGVLSQKIPNAVNQKIQNIVQQQGALAAKDAIDAQVENGTITAEDASEIKSKVDEVEAADKSLEQLGVSPEIRLAAGALSAKVTDLENRISQEKNPAVLSKLNQEKKAAQAEMDAIVSGEKGFVLITPEGGAAYAVPESAAKEVVQDLKEEIQSGEVTAEKVGEVAVELPKPKKRRLPKFTMVEEVEAAAPAATETKAEAQAAEPTVETAQTIPASETAPTSAATTAVSEPTQPITSEPTTQEPGISTVEGLSKALEETQKSNPTVWEKIKEFVKGVGRKIGIVSNEEHISNFEKAKAEWDKLDARGKKLKRADYELDDLHHSEGGYYKVGKTLFDLDLNSNHVKLLLENNRFLNILSKLGVNKIHGENRPAEEMFAHYSDNKIHLNNNSNFENIRQVTNAMSHELGHHEWTKLTKAERDYVKTLPLETGMAKHYEAQEKNGGVKETSASLQEENFADYVMQYFQGKMYGDEALLNKIPTKLRELFDKKYGELLNEKSESAEVAEAYHSDKQSGKETELTKAVDKLFPKPAKTKNETATTAVSEPVSKTTAEPAAEAKAGVEETVQPSATTDSGDGAAGAASVLTPEQEIEVVRAAKPSVKLELVQTKELVNSSDPLTAKKKHDDIKERYKLLKALVECL